MILDRDFMAGMVHTVELQVDSNRDGAITDDRGRSYPIYTPVPGHTAVMCRVAMQAAQDRTLDRKPGATSDGIILFPGPGAMTDALPITFDLTARLVWTDPADGSVRTLTPMGRLLPYNDQTTRVHHFACHVTEFIA